MKPIAIAIDGPAGAGKSTVARALAKRLGYVYIDTGAMYRAVTYYLQQKNVPIGDEDKVGQSIQNLQIRINGENVTVNGVDVTAWLRTEKVSAVVSTVAAYPVVRKLLVKEQRTMAQAGGVVMDGRDIGTIVLPHADLKVFLTASVQVRAQRRWLQNRHMGIESQMTQVELERAIRQRDQKDSERAVSPLRQASDARLLDNSDLTTEETVVKIANWAKQVMHYVS